MAFHSFAPAPTDIRFRAGPVAPPIAADGPVVRIAAEEGAHGVAVLSGAVREIGVHLAAGSSVQIAVAWDGAGAEARATLAAGAHLHWHVVQLSGGTTEIVSVLQGDDARCDIDAVVVAGEGGAPALAVTNEYRGKRGAGDMAMRVIGTGASRSRCHGMIRIAEGGGGTDTYLAQRVLLLGAAATVDAVPALEIRTNDVKASHGATVTRLSPLDLFAFGARGIAPDEARRLFVDGWLHAGVACAPDAQWREDVLALAHAALRA